MGGYAPYIATDTRILRAIWGCYFGGSSGFHPSLFSHTEDKCVLKGPLSVLKLSFNERGAVPPFPQNEASLYFQRGLQQVWGNSLPSTNMEPDGGVLEDHILLKGFSTGFQYSGQEGRGCFGV